MNKPKPLTLDEHDVLLTPAELAARWSVSRGHLSNLRGAGAGIAFVKVGHNTVRYRLSDVLAHEAGRTVQPLSA